MRCAVTGGAGFIGSHVTDILINEGHEVTIIDDLSGGFKKNIHPKAAFIKKDLIHLEPNDLKNVDIVYHLAAHAAEGLSFFVPFYNAQKNYLSFIKLLTECINNNVSKIIFTSSMSVYGYNPKLPFDENQPRNPCDPYGIAKASIERMLEIYSNEFKLHYVIIRPHNVYGIKQNIYDPYRNVIGIWINRLMHNKPPIIYGDGEQVRAFSYIDDIAKYIVKSGFTEKAYGEIINLGSSNLRTINEVCKIVIDAFGKDVSPIYYPPRIGEVKYAYTTTVKSKKILDFKESTSIQDGIKKYISWAIKLPQSSFQYLNEDIYEILKKMPTTWKLHHM